MATETFRCADAAEERSEPLFGSASHVWNWLLLEQPGSWGSDALMESRIPTETATELRRRARASGIRIVLIRRGVRFSGPERQCYFAQTTETTSRLSHMSFQTLDELMDIDLEAVCKGTLPPGAVESTAPTFLVCTHGRHDACCSIRGNQVSRVACALPEVDAWECSHIGGDRFAANMICFPHGLYYGRVAPEDVERLVNLYGRGEISLKHFRGRSAFPFATQAAEGFVRQQTGLLGIGDISLLERKQSNEGITAKFALVDGRTAEVELRISASPEPHRLTCALRPSKTIPIYELKRCDLGT